MLPWPAATWASDCPLPQGGFGPPGRDGDDPRHRGWSIGGTRGVSERTSGPERSVPGSGATMQKARPGAAKPRPDTGWPADP
jgi:hypothetical protein